MIWRLTGNPCSSASEKDEGQSDALNKGFARATGEGLARNAPHPNAAVLFFDFLIGDEGQHILAKRQFVTVSRSIESPFNQGPLQLIDSAAILDHARKWQDLYQKTVVAPLR